MCPNHMFPFVGQVCFIIHQIEPLDKEYAVTLNHLPRSKVNVVHVLEVFEKSLYRPYIYIVYPSSFLVSI